MPSQIDYRYIEAARRHLDRPDPQPVYRTVATIVTGPLVWLVVERRPR